MKINNGPLVPIGTRVSPAETNSPPLPPKSLGEKIYEKWGSTSDSDGNKIVDMLTKLNIISNTTYRDGESFQVIILNGKEQETEIRNEISEINNSQTKCMTQKPGGPSHFMIAETEGNDVILTRLFRNYK